MKIKRFMSSHQNKSGNARNEKKKIKTIIQATWRRPQRCVTCPRWQMKGIKMCKLQGKGHNIFKTIDYSDLNQQHLSEHQSRSHHSLIENLCCSGRSPEIQTRPATWRSWEQNLQWSSTLLFIEVVNQHQPASKL